MFKIIYFFILTIPMASFSNPANLEANQGLLGGFGKQYIEYMAPLQEKLTEGLKKKVQTNTLDEKAKLLLKESISIQRGYELILTRKLPEAEVITGLLLFAQFSIESLELLYPNSYSTKQFNLFMINQLISKAKNYLSTKPETPLEKRRLQDALSALEIFKQHYENTQQFPPLTKNEAETLTNIQRTDGGSIQKLNEQLAKELINNAQQISLHTQGINKGIERTVEEVQEMIKQGQKATKYIRKAAVNLEEHIIREIEKMIENRKNDRKYKKSNPKHK